MQDTTRPTTFPEDTTLDDSQRGLDRFGQRVQGNPPDGGLPTTTQPTEKPSSSNRVPLFRGLSASSRLTRQYTEENDDDDPFQIAFVYKDPNDPRHWAEWYKWTMFILYLWPEIWAQAISSLFAPATSTAAEAVGVSEAAMRTVQAIYLFGFALGPIAVAPISEDYGRKWIGVLSILIVSLCQIPCAFANSLGLILPFRFIAGFFAAATFNSIGVVADLWDPVDQGWGVNLFCLAAEIGADLGAVMGGYIHASLGWRWTFGVSGLGMIFITCLLLVFGRETRGGVILSKSAAKKRKETGDDRYYCIHEKVVAAKTWRLRFTETIGRPVWMLCTEPIVLTTALFDGLNYMVIYAFILGFALVYGNVYGWSNGNEELPLVAAVTGSLIAFFCLPLQQLWERRCIRRSSDGELVPEERLFWLIVSPLFPAALFWFAWTAVPGIHWASSVISIGLVGFVSHIIFYAVSDYTVAAYSLYAASAVGAQSLMREVLSGSFTLFVVQAYENLGYPWASSLWGFLAVVVAVVPFALYFYGHKLRNKSPFCREQMQATLDIRKETERLRDKHERSEERSRSRSRSRSRARQPATASTEGEAAVVGTTSTTSSASLPWQGLRKTDVEKSAGAEQRQQQQQQQQEEDRVGRRRRHDTPADAPSPATLDGRG